MIERRPFDDLSGEDIGWLRWATRSKKSPELSASSGPEGNPQRAPARKGEEGREPFATFRRAVGPPFRPGEDPLFTDFTASNIGTPANPQLPYYAEQRPDAYGYSANPAGSAYVDPGVAGFLSTYQLLSQPSTASIRAGCRSSPCTTLMLSSSFKWG
jgi:hypothetical protein